MVFLRVVFSSKRAQACSDEQQLPNADRREQSAQIPTDTDRPNQREAEGRPGIDQGRPAGHQGGEHQAQEGAERAAKQLDPTAHHHAGEFESRGRRNEQWPLAALCRVWAIRRGPVL